MNRRLVLPWLTALSALLMLGCSNTPEEPAFLNPFDPAGPTGGDPFDVVAVFAQDRVILSWTNPLGFGITSYTVLRSTDAVLYESIGDVPAGTTSSMSFEDLAPIATTRNYYKVRGTTADGTITFDGRVAAASVPVPPLVTIGNGSATTARRYVPVRIAATGYDWVRLAPTADFAEPTTTVAVVGDSLAVVENWDLGPANANGDTLRVAAYAFNDLGGSITSSPTVVVPVIVRFQPTLALPGGATTVATAQISLAVSDSAAGVARLRLALSADGLASAPWRDPAAVITGFELTDSPQPQTVYAQFESEFSGTLTATASLLVTPDDLSAAAFHLDLPANRVVTNPIVRVLADAVATHMRVSTQPGFPGAVWTLYADTTTVDLGEQPGFRTVYAQFRNHWTDSAVLTAWAVVSTAGVIVEFDNPRDGDVIPRGAFVELRGRAWGTTAGVDSVKVNVGGGFALAVGNDDWSFGWTVPTDAPSPLNLTARAYAGTDSATAWIQVLTQ